MKHEYIKTFTNMCVNILDIIDKTKKIKLVDDLS